MALWFLADQVALHLGFSVVGLLGLIYAIIPIVLVARPELPVFAVYRWMPVVNTIVGLVLFFTLAL